MNVKQKTDFKKDLLVGVGEVVILGFSPSRKKLNEILNYTPEEGKEQEEMVYLNDNYELKLKDSEGNETGSVNCNQVFIDVWVEEVITKNKYKIRFGIVQHDKISKSGKTQYTNQLGQTTWVDDENNLPEFFTHFVNKDKKDPNNKTTSPKTYRKALIGEENLYEFLSKWLNINKFDNECDIMLDNRKLMKADFSELNSLVADNSNSTVMCAFTVKTKEVTDKETGNTEMKEYQSVNNKFFAPGKCMKFWNNYEKQNFEGLNKKVKGLYDLAVFYENCTNSENGIKDFWIAQSLKPYNPDVKIENHEPVNSTDSNY